MKPETKLYYLHHPYYRPVKGPAIIRCKAESVNHDCVSITETSEGDEIFDTSKKGYGGYADMLVVDVQTCEIVHLPQPHHRDELKSQCPEPDSALMAMVIAQLIKEGIYDQRKES